MKFEIHRHINQIPAEIARENEERKLKRWYDPRVKGSVAYRFATFVMAGTVVVLAGDKLINSVSDEIGGVFADETEKIRADLQKPIDDVQKAKSVVEGLEADVIELKQWFTENFGVDFGDENGD